MKKLLAFLLFLSALSVAAQLPPPSTYTPQLITFNNAPFGPCAVYQVAQNQATGAFFVCVNKAWSQLAAGATSHGIGAPTNPCIAGNLYTNDSNGNVYSCNSGTWAIISGGGGGTIGGSIAAGQIGFGSGANTIAGDASFAHNTSLGVTEQDCDPTTLSTAMEPACLIGLATGTVSTGINNTSGILGESLPTVNSPNTVASQFAGVSGIGKAQGTGTYSGFVAGQNGQGIFAGSGTVTNLAAFLANTDINNGGGTVTNNFGMDCNDQHGIGSTLNACYYAPDQGTGANDYAAYFAGGKVHSVGAIDSNGGVSANSDGTHAGLISLLGNTTAPAIAANSFGFAGPSSAAFTSYFFQPSSTAPTTGQCLVVGTVALPVVPLNYNTCAGGSAFPVTVTGGVSGGISYFSSTTVESASPILNTNILIKGGGAGNPPTNSLTTDDGTASTYTGTGGTKSPVFTSTGTTAGFVDYPQGTTSTAVAPCNVATSICEQAPTAVTSYLVTKPGAAPTVNGSFAATSTAGVQSWQTANLQFCGTTTSCAGTAEPLAKIVYGSAPLVSGTPSTAAVTGISPAFTATGDYVCTVSAQSAATTALLSVANVSASAFTITGPATVSTVINYICVGF